jgi:FdhD protein
LRSSIKYNLIGGEDAVRMADDAMIDPIIDLPYVEWDGKQATTVRRPVIAETPWVVYVDGRELLTLMCSPTDLHDLVIGFLLNEGLITQLDDLWQLKVFIDDDRAHVVFPASGLNEVVPVSVCPESVGSIVVQLAQPLPALPERRVLTSGCGGGITFDTLHRDRDPLHSDLRITASQVIALMRELNYGAQLYRQSRGVHTSALSDGERLLIQAEDVGRHNTLDKLRGRALLNNIMTQDRILLTSGRISSEMISKARSMDVPLVVSRTSPTATSIRLAQRWNMTLIGYARAPQFRVYTGAERVVWE